jgi:hypothetical protein
MNSRDFGAPSLAEERLPRIAAADAALLSGHASAVDCAGDRDQTARPSIEVTGTAIASTPEPSQSIDTIDKKKLGRATADPFCMRCAGYPASP